jgi:hypothetical protein
VLCISFECQEGEPVPIRYTRAFKLHITHLLVPNTVTFTNFLHASCNMHGVLIPIAWDDKYAAHEGDAVRMGTECSISFLAAGLHVTGSMAVVLGCLLPVYRNRS